MASRQMPSDRALRVIVADDDPFARRLIKGALEQAGMIVIAEAKDGDEAIELGVHHRPDVIVMDAVMGRVRTARLRRLAWLAGGGRLSRDAPGPANSCDERKPPTRRRLGVLALSFLTRRCVRATLQPAL